MSISCLYIGIILNLLFLGTINELEVLCMTKNGRYHNQICTLNNKDYYINDITELNKLAK